MKVKVKDPSRVYYDSEQGVAMTGKKVFEVKVTGYVREELRVGSLIEVAEVKEPVKEPVKELVKEPVKKPIKVK